ncbi:condensin-2 complex subunit H2 isoform X2 [Takifugu rubripes]|uniref:condensin-2 complex subunit H2 isoform X2 n=1 Tax=Takifugu rubripes TaxID=31033 RepID=UPI0011452612|nr:condensin-2 complex subunit H2 isoform X2 [Takifugu rubripes]
MESTESRFAHLLQPIRELTKNWDIDVAAALNDYLEELDEMCITFDGGKTGLNFAEAALLIQGSTSIYSKKVELLHSLVYQTLEYISEKNRKRNKQTAEAQQGDTDGAHSDHDEHFTQLDLDTAEDSHKNHSTTTALVVPLPPESLLPPESREKLKLPLISLKGETLCSVKDFRINLFIPGAEDMIVLLLGSAASTHLLDKCPAESLQQQDDMEGAENGCGVSQDFHPLDINMEEEAHEQGVEPVFRQQEAELVHRQQASTGRMTAERRRRPDAGRAEEAPPTVNVWEVHEPYSVIGRDKPCKSGKCFRVPDGLDGGGKRKRKQGSCLEDFRSWFTGSFNPPEQKLKNGPVFTDLNFIYLNSVKDKLKTQRRIYRKAGLVVSEEELRRTLLQPEEAGLHPQGAGLDGFHHADLLGGEDLSDNEHEAFPDDAPAEVVRGPGNADDEVSYEDLVRLRVEQLLVSSQGFTQETALSQRVRDWEDAIQPELLRLEARPAFDIHDYSDRVVAALGSVARRRSFASIVAGLDNVEVCKYLLASLQLANDHTVAVDQAGGLDSSVDTMGLTLLSTVRATDRFKTLTTST